MKYIVVLGDGMADYPIEELGNKTPLQYAKKPTTDYLVKHGVLGRVRTIPEGMPTGSDTANLSVLGYDPHLCYSGRSPFEASSIGVSMKKTDVSFRCNLITLSEEEEFENRLILDHSADEITTEEAKELMDAVNTHFSTESIVFYLGISYRHLMIWDHGPYEWNLTPPHDIIGRKIGDYLPRGSGSEIIETMMRESVDFLGIHPINQKRIEKGLKPANAIWIWGEGKKPSISSFKEKYGLEGSVISAVDLIKGLGICAGLDSIEVEGATGNIHTNFVGKAKAAVLELKKGKDFVYLHIEAPDECGHRFELENKVKSIELIDEKVLRIVKEEMDLLGEEYSLMFLPDHPTPLSLRTHTADPVPFLIYRSNKELSNPHQTYDEKGGSKTGILFEKGHELMDHFIKQLI